MEYDSHLVLCIKAKTQYQKGQRVLQKGYPLRAAPILHLGRCMVFLAYLRASPTEVRHLLFDRHLADKGGKQCGRHHG